MVINHIHWLSYVVQTFKLTFHKSYKALLCDDSSICFDYAYSIIKIYYSTEINMSSCVTLFTTIIIIPTKRQHSHHVHALAVVSNQVEAFSLTFHKSYKAILCECSISGCLYPLITVTKIML